MKVWVRLFVAVLALVAGVLCLNPCPVLASERRNIRLGYLDASGSALCRLALEKGHFREEGLQVELIGFPDSTAGLAALAAGKIDAGAFSVGDSLRAVASGNALRIIAGGGTPLSDDPLAELDDSLQAENDLRGVVVLIPPGGRAGKETLTRLTAALIRAYRTLRVHPEILSPLPGNRRDRMSFDPNPEFYRLERIWRSLGLQTPAMKRDFLADHIYEEIYCDALDRLLDNAAEDPVYKDLSSKAVCTPDCCPKKAAKK